MNSADVWEARLPSFPDPPPGVAVTIAYLACGKTKYAVAAPHAHPGRALKPSRSISFPYGMKLLRRGLTATGAERVANRANAVALALARLA